MTINIRKKLAALILTSLSVLALGVTLSSSPKLTNAEGCQHTGNHYTIRAATESSTGCKEYWVCCGCHEHFLEKPSIGTWADAGEATAVVDSTDNRCILKTSDTTELAKAVEAAGFGDYTINDDGTIGVNHYTADKKNPNSKYVVIPEGVTSLNGDTFKGYNKDNAIEYVIVPSTVKSISGDALGNLGLGKLKDSIVWYFVGNFVYNKEIKKYCEVLNTGWHYGTNGAPVADKLIKA